MLWNAFGLCEFLVNMTTQAIFSNLTPLLCSGIYIKCYYESRTNAHSSWPLKPTYHRTYFIHRNIQFPRFLLIPDVDI